MLSYPNWLNSFSFKTIKKNDRLLFMRRSFFIVLFLLSWSGDYFFSSLSIVFNMRA